MRLRINGEEKNFPEETQTVSQLIQNLALNSPRVAVEVNGTIVPPSSFDEATVKNNDSIEIVAFVGGG